MYNIVCGTMVDVHSKNVDLKVKKNLIAENVKSIKLLYYATGSGAEKKVVS